MEEPRRWWRSWGGDVGVANNEGTSWGFKENFSWGIASKLSVAGSKGGDQEEDIWGLKDVEKPWVWDYGQAPKWIFSPSWRQS